MMRNTFNKYMHTQASAQYVIRREFGCNSFRERQGTVDSLVKCRNMRPFVADTPNSCRSTFLLRLNCENTLLAAAHGDSSVAIYCPTSGKMLAKCDGHSRSPWTLDFHPSHPYLLATGCIGGSIRLWNLECLGSAATTSPVPNIKCFRDWSHTGAVASLAFHPVHPIIVVACTQDVLFYDWHSGHQLSAWRFVSNQSRVRWVRFNNDGTLLYTATANPQPHSSGEQVIINSNEFGFHNDKLSLNFDGQHSLYPVPVPRHLLLEFLMCQPDLWYTCLGICDLCSIRLCRWAGGIGSPFPPKSVNIQKSLSVALSTAQVIAGKLCLAGLPLTRTVRELMNLKDSAGLLQLIMRDVHPRAVAIIEDMPVREFLLSRGNHCTEPSTARTNISGICCGAHACDLVLVHRLLMRHSMCRPCLASFWRWATKSVDWWQPGGNSSFLEPTEPAVFENIPSSLQGVEHINCDVRLSYSPKIPFNHSNGRMVGICIQCQANAASDGSISDLQCTETTPKTNKEKRSTDTHSFPLAALEVVRSRLSNASEVTPLTYMSLDLICTGALDDYFRDFFARANDVALGPLQEPRTSAKRRKSETHQLTVPGGSSEFSEQPTKVSRLTPTVSGVKQNRPHRAHLLPSSLMPDDFPPLKFFNYVDLGSQLLRPTLYRSSEGDCQDVSIELSYPKDVFYDGHRMLTACCRCGRIAPHTFPVDPRSNLSAMVCRELVMSANPGGVIDRFYHNSRATEQPSSSTSGSDEHSSHVQSNLDNAPVNRNSMMYLLNQTNSNSMLNAVHRTVTEVIAGLLVDMGEHGSAASLQDTTYRVCSWDLSLRGAVYYDFPHASNETEAMCPMPANIAVSYNNNSLVVPHARLFNDSSVCLSPDGNILAAFVIPWACGEHCPGNGKTTFPDTVLAVFRLQPKSHRGRCLFARRFESCSPVCLDFSPLSDYLAVGMASSRLPASSSSYFLPNINGSGPNHTELINGPSTSNAQPRTLSGPTRHFLVAQVFHLHGLSKRQVSYDDNNSLSRVLLKAAVIKHPSLLDPVSCSRQHMLQGSNSKDLDILDRWHRLLLSTPTGISLNTILWNPNGGLLYGTTKGLIVLMKTHPSPSNTDHSSDQEAPDNTLE